MYCRLVFTGVSTLPSKGGRFIYAGVDYGEIFEPHFINDNKDIEFTVKLSEKQILQLQESIEAKHPKAKHPHTSIFL